MSTHPPRPDLTHPVPAAMHLRPTTTLRTPLGVVRLPTRAIIIGGLTLIGWLGLTLLTGTWYFSTSVIIPPAALFLMLVEGRIRGRAPLAWVYLGWAYRRHRAVVTAPRLLRPPRRDT